MQSSDLSVHYHCRYLTNVEVGWRDEDYKARGMVRSIKGDNFRGSFRISVDGVVEEFDQSKADRFRSICHSPLVNILKLAYPNGGIICPIPTSKTIKHDSPFRTKDIAARLVKKAGDKYQCNPLLTFKTEMTSSHSGGNRNPYHIESNLALHSNPTLPVILFDDVLTTGAHMQASFWKLTQNKFDVIGAITFARTVQSNEYPAFGNYSDKVHVEKMNQLFPFDG